MSNIDNNHKKEVKKMDSNDQSQLFSFRELDLVKNGTNEEKKEIINRMIEILLKRNELKFEKESLDKSSRIAREFFVDYILELSMPIRHNGYEISVSEYKNTKFLRITKIKRTVVNYEKN